MYEQNASYLVKHSNSQDLGTKILHKICLKIVPKVLKWPQQQVDFQNFLGSIPQNPPRAFFILNMLQNDFAKKLLLIICQKRCPLPKKIFEYAADHKTFFKELFGLFLGPFGSNVFVFS